MPSVVQKEVEQEAKKTLTIRLSPAVYEYVKASAKRAGVSMNIYVTTRLKGGSRDVLNKVGRPQDGQE